MLWAALVNISAKGETVRFVLWNSSSALQHATRMPQLPSAGCRLHAACGVSPCARGLCGMVCSGRTPVGLTACWILSALWPASLACSLRLCSNFLILTFDTHAST